MMLHMPDWSPEILEQAGITTKTVEDLGQLLDEYLVQFKGKNYAGVKRQYCGSLGKRERRYFKAEKMVGTKPYILKFV